MYWYEQVSIPNRAFRRQSVFHLNRWLFIFCAASSLLARTTVGSIAAPTSLIEITPIDNKGADGRRLIQQISDVMPTLAIAQVISARPHRPCLFPLSINADGVVPDQSLIAIHGLPKGAVLSAGRSDGAGAWLLAPDDLGAALFLTPGDADSLSDLDLQFITPQGHAASELHAKLIVSRDAQASEPFVTTTSEQIQVLLAHGRELQRVGYLAGARLFFQRAAEAGSAEGARALGETYDPIEFEKLGVRGMVPDPALARQWYDRARALEEKRPKETQPVE
jgi:hypothetical protein